MNITTLRQRGTAYTLIAFLLFSIFAFTPNVGAQNQACEGSDPLVFNVDTDIAGSYNVWSRVNLRDSTNNTKLHTEANGSCIETDLGSSKNQWTWVKSSRKLGLRKNSQTVDAHISNGEVWIDKMIFTLDDNCTPEGLGEACITSKIEAILSGVEPGGVVGAELTLFADISGLSDSPEVSFAVDGVIVSEEITPADGIYCLGPIKFTTCGPWDTSELAAGEHSVVLTVRDSGRSLSASRTFMIDKGIATVPDEEKKSSPTQQEPRNSLKSSATAEDIEQSQSETPESGVNIQNKAIANQRIPVSSGVVENTVPTVVIDTYTSPASNLEGDVVLTVPGSTVTSPDDTIIFTVDGEEIAETAASSPEVTLDTSELDNKRHEIGATVLNSNGERTSVEIPVIVNNSPFDGLKRAVTSTTARVMVVLVMMGAALTITVVKVKKHILLQQINTARVINPQPLANSSPLSLQPGMAAAAMVVALTGLSGVVIASPSLYESKTYSGNASILIELEIAQVGSAHMVGTSDVDVFPVIEYVMISAEEGPTDPSPDPVPVPQDYTANLAKIKAQSFRNRNEDDSVYKDYSMQRLDAIVDELLRQPRSDYEDGGFREEYTDQNRSNLDNAGLAAMRTGCEFSHFAYDDPIVYPGQPEVAHLHMFFGNTDVNAYTTYDTLFNSGGGTCNGGELNRTGYWVPAMFDGAGSVVIPDFMNIYYKNDSIESQNTSQWIEERVFAEAYPVSAEDTWVKDSFEGARVPNFEGVQIVTRSTMEFQADNSDATIWRCIYEDGHTTQQHKGSLANSLQCPDQPSESHGKSYFEAEIYFPTCWNGQDPSDWQSDNIGLAKGGFYWRDCDGAGYDHQFSGIQYRVRYTVNPGEDTRDWFIASDIDKTTRNKVVDNGYSIHADWWGGWNPTVNQMWIDNCGNEKGTACGYGFMDAETTEESPNGPTLRYREKFQGSQRVPVQDVYNALCSVPKTINRDTDAAYCR